MYSMVLAMALSGGAATPADHGCGGMVCYGGGCYASSCHGCHGGGHKLFGGLFNRHGCHGCNGCSGCYSSACHGCNGCSGCHGGHRLFGGLFKRHHSCHGCNGCNGCSGCYSSCHGCHGTVIMHGCQGCAGCHGTAVPPPPPGKPMPEPVKAPQKGTEEASANNAATLIVSLPAEARLSIDDNATSQTSATRVFVTPELETGRDFVYTLKAELVRDGQNVTASKQVTVRAGQETRVTLEFPTANVASR